jgi:L-lactate utilization protein LutB
VLPKNATGQKITSYVSFIKGPSGGDGRELHIVLLDNGRMKLAADDDFSQALQCVKCGACANVCPIYEIVGGHVFGHIYVGGIGLVPPLSSMVSTRRRKSSSCASVAGNATKCAPRR